MFIAYDAYRSSRTEEEEAIVTKIVGGWVKRIKDMFEPTSKLEVTTDFYEPILDDFGVQRTKRKRFPLTNELGIQLRTMDNVPRWRMEAVPQYRKTTRPAPCPECGERFAFDPATGDRITALVIEYREAGERTLEAATATCRSCGIGWKGKGGLEELAASISDDDTPNAIDVVQSPEKLLL